MSWQEELKDFRNSVKAVKVEHLDWGKRKISRHLGCSESRAGRALAWLKKNFDNVEDIKSAKVAIDRDFKERTAFITIKNLNIRTVEEALEIADVDTEIWEVERFQTNSWEVTTKLRKYKEYKEEHIRTDDVPERFTNWQVKVWLRRKTPATRSIGLLIKNLEKRSPDFKPIKRAKLKDKKHLLEISLFDLHLGLLAWDEEVGKNYDVEIAKEIYLNAILDSTNNVPDTVEEILFPVGQDFFHINNPMGTTPKAGNFLDMDSRLAYIYNNGEQAVIEGIEHCRKIAPVKVLWVPGNHDPETSFYLCRTIDAWFRNDKEVTVDVSPMMRKYYHYGVNLLGFTHGDEEPIKSLPTIMADEKPEEWARSKFREWHIAHVHRERKFDFTKIDSIGSTCVRVLPSLAGTDAWHYKKGYVGGNKITQSYLWDKDNGLESIFYTYVRRNK